MKIDIEIWFSPNCLRTDNVFQWTTTTSTYINTDLDLSTCGCDLSYR